ncbi:hypothetical protein ECG_00336 [Echinococcus granulosus]|nr:hypothetical protein ECG_00336 [Echinococcus granulosus]
MRHFSSPPLKTAILLHTKSSWFPYFLLLVWSSCAADFFAPDFMASEVLVTTSGDDSSGRLDAVDLSLPLPSGWAVETLTSENSVATAADRETLLSTLVEEAVSWSAE